MSKKAHTHTCPDCKAVELAPPDAYLHCEKCAMPMTPPVPREVPPEMQTRTHTRENF